MYGIGVKQDLRWILRPDLESDQRFSPLSSAGPEYTQSRTRLGTDNTSLHIRSLNYYLTCRGSKEQSDPRFSNLPFSLFFPMVFRQAFSEPRAIIRRSAHSFGVRCDRL
jgi:hypothetical protein